jgi:hypothetical protein
VEHSDPDAGVGSQLQTMQRSWQAVTLSKQVLTIINERLPLHGLQLRPYASVGSSGSKNSIWFLPLRLAVTAADTARR